jgi:hypothetical protein
MKSWRWDLIAAAFILALALIAHAALPRYVPDGSGQILDRWSGRICQIRCSSAQLSLEDWTRQEAAIRASSGDSLRPIIEPPDPEPGRK